MFFISPGLRFLKIDCFPLSIPVLQNLFKYWSGKKGTGNCRRSNYCPYRFWGFFYIFVYILSKLSYKLEKVLTSKKKKILRKKSLYYLQSVIEEYSFCSRRGTEFKWHTAWVIMMKSCSQDIFWKRSSGEERICKQTRNLCLFCNRMLLQKDQRI